MVLNLLTACTRVNEIGVVSMIPNLVSGSEFQKDRLTDGSGGPIWAWFAAFLKPELGPRFSLRYSVLNERLLEGSFDPSCNLF